MQADLDHVTQHAKWYLKQRIRVRWTEAHQDGGRDGGAPQAEGTVTRGRLRWGFLEPKFYAGPCAALFHVFSCQAPAYTSFLAPVVVLCLLS